MNAVQLVKEHKRHLRVLTNSELSTFRRCQREHHLRYRILRRPIKRAAALRFGTLVHKALEAWWLAQPESRLANSWQAILEHGQDSDAYELAAARALMAGYTARWTEETTVRVIAVEAHWSSTLVHPDTGDELDGVELRGKLDVLTVAGFVEHKTATADIEVGSDYWRRISALDSQVSMYDIGSRSLGVVGSCTYDVLRKPLVKPLQATPEASRKYTKPKVDKKTGEVIEPSRLYAGQRDTDETPEEYEQRLMADIAERPQEYFARGEIVRLEHDVYEHALDTWDTVQSMLDAERASRAPRNPDACIRYKRECEYFGVCSGQASIDDDTLFYTADSAHEELEEKEIQQ